jgi:arylsulfatase A
VQVRGDPVRRSKEGGWNRWNPADDAERIAKYRGMVLPIDEGVGQIRETLIRLGLDKNTLVLFFSDNGASSDFPSGSPQWRGNKGSVHEGGHRVPFIAWWPGKITPGASSAVPTITLDVMPTLLALAGVTPSVERPLDGVDLSNLLLKGESPVSRPLTGPASLGNNGSRNEAMRDGPWKLVVNHPQAKPGSFDNEQVELCRLDQDPSEKNNLADSESDQTKTPLTRLKAWSADTQRTATPQVGGW